MFLVDMIGIVFVLEYEDLWVDKYVFWLFMEFFSDEKINREVIFI